MKKKSVKVQKVLDAEYYDPFEVLGLHQDRVKTKIIIRTFLPDLAKEVYLVELGGEGSNKRMLQMKDVHKLGFYEVSLVAEVTSFKYMLKIVGNDKVERIIHDPYSFPPVLSDFDIHLFGEGRHTESYAKLGANLINHNGVDGVSFAVWAPNACRVSVVSDFNGWDGRIHQMRMRGCGIWELFIPGVSAGEKYKFEVKSMSKDIYIKSDPYGFYSEYRPSTASIIYDINKFSWTDSRWIERRDASDNFNAPVSIYELHLDSWARVPEEGDRPLTYKEMAVRLAEYIKSMNYTHIQLMPISEFPYDGSWGYQVTGYFAPTSRYGTPEDFAYFVDHMHANDIGVLLDWVPAHFPRDEHGLAYFDGTHLYEHADPKKGAHQDWGTLIFNYDRNEVKNFLISSGLFWMEKYHIDGLRVDAVASMLYLDYSREEGEWIPNEFGGRENIGAVNFLREFSEIAHEKFPGTMMIAEESTSWPAVSRPVYLGGLGFGYKWNMGWMNDTLRYFALDPVHRKFHQDMLTFSMIYAYHENFILVFSHDEVVHGKKSLLDKMPGDVWQKFANLRLLFCYMFAHPGKKMIFMGSEFGQWEEWNFAESIKWHLLEFDSHKKLQKMVADLNGLYKSEPSLYEVDYNDSGFEWIDLTDVDNCVFSFMRKSKKHDDFTICIFNMTPVVRTQYRVGVPLGCNYKEVFNSDLEQYWGSDVNNEGVIYAEDANWQNRPFSVTVNLPPLGAVFIKPE